MIKTAQVSSWFSISSSKEVYDHCIIFNRNSIIHQTNHTNVTSAHFYSTAKDSFFI